MSGGTGWAGLKSGKENSLCGPPLLKTLCALKNPPFHLRNCSLLRTLPLSSQNLHLLTKPPSRQGTPQFLGNPHFLQNPPSQRTPLSSRNPFSVSLKNRNSCLTKPLSSHGPLSFPREPPTPHSPVSPPLLSSLTSLRPARAWPHLSAPPRSACAARGSAAARGRERNG